jgi:hypothetical protein
MKAVIVEIKGNAAALLSEDGRVLKVKNKNYVIGQEITIKNNKIKIAISVAFVLILAAAFAWLYLTRWR